MYCVQPNRGETEKYKYYALLRALSHFLTLQYQHLQLFNPHDREGIGLLLIVVWRGMDKPRKAQKWHQRPVQVRNEVPFRMIDQN